MDSLSFENKNILTNLQSYLKKEVHLLQREHNQKKKMYQQLQDVLQSYYMIYTTLLHPEGHVTSDEGLGNCYNFIKQVCMMVSRDVQLGTMILLQSELNTPNHNHLSQAMINIIYENLAEKQEYKKPTYLLLRNLIQKILAKLTKNHEEQEKNIEIDSHAIKKIKHYVDIFLKKQEINDYFYDITKPMATQIMSLDLNTLQKKYRNAYISQAFRTSVNQQQQIENPDSFQRTLEKYSFCSQRNQPRLCSFIKQPDIPLKQRKAQIYAQYCQRLIQQASFAPTSIKIIVKLLYCEFQQHYQKKINEINEINTKTSIKSKIYKLIWYTIKDCYINPMKKIEGDLFMKLQDIDRNKILQEMRQKFEKDTQQHKNKLIENIIARLLLINEKKYETFCEKYNEIKNHKKFILPFLVENTNSPEKPNDSQKKIENAQQTPTIFTRAICMNYRQLYLLLCTLKQCSKLLTATNGTQYPKILNRVNKLYEMSHELQILTSRKNGNFSYVLFMEVKLTGILQSDYHKIYVQQYKDNNLKNTLRQVLVQLGDIYHEDRQCYSNGRGYTRKYKDGDLQCYLKAVINEYALQKQGRKIRKEEIMNIPLSCLSENISNMPTTLIVKIKYLQWMITSNKSQSEQSLLTQMLQQCEERLNRSVNVYQYAKFTLLRAISNIKNNKHSHEFKKKNQIKSCNQLKNTILIQNTTVNLCITSPATRQNQKSGGSIEQLKYRMSSANQIIFTDIKHCMHKDNPFSGLQWHSDHPKQLIKTFCSLPQVKTAIATGIDKVGIKFSLYNIIELLKTEIKKQNQFEAEEIVYLSKHLNYLMMRTLHYYLLEKEVYNEDQHFYLKTLKLSSVKSKYLAIPVESNLQPIWQICSKYLHDLQNQNTPQSKIKYLKEILETVKIALYGHDNHSIGKQYHKNKKRKASSQETHLKSQIGSQSTEKTVENCIQKYEQVMMVYIIIRSKPKTLISNINFIETFLPDSKLLSSDGEILKFMNKAISKIKNEELTEYLTIDLNDIRCENLKQSLIATYKQV